jgi:isopenicillin N synthase-like dioxygenase
MTADTIPTIDLTPLREGSESGKRAVSRAIDAVCTDIGFFVVVGHGVPDDQITSTRRHAIDFFALPEAEKMKVARPPAKISRGYNWVGDRSLSYTLGQAAPPDLQEAFAFGPERVAQLAACVDPASAQMYAPNIWPERPHDFRQVMLAYYDAMSGLAANVLRAMRQRSVWTRAFLPTSSSEPRALRA